MSSAALVVHTPQSMDIAPRQVSLLRPIAAPAEIIAAQEATRDLVAQALKKDRDYGVIRGTDKATLLKPGAERVAIAFGCFFGEPEIIEKECDHDRVVQWSKRKGTGTSTGLYRYVLRVPVIERASGLVVGYGIGSCSSMESKYIENPRDAENTIFKMAHKRAIVGGTLVTFGLSDQFTQDVEDLPREDDDTPAPVAGVDEPEARCPKCKGPMWDNRKKKTNPKAPDFKCKTGCEGGVYWTGQWPPVTVPMASAELRDELARFAADPRVTKAVREKLLGFDGQELTQEKAVKWIEKLQLKYPAEVAEQHEGPTAATSAADLQKTASAGLTATAPSAANSAGADRSEPDLVKAAADQQRRAEAPKQRGTPMPANYGGEGQIPL